ncbi:probable peptidoglycan muropeptide transporter SLC46 isoform X1 [Drosophila sulfurigaster albostrigata]|uniref:probable peptidoglycan muropeptide transporter SLC46 isoform X1 n=2 Tax=Drosophila sulfurigaster albostrigata TaxID=89887 RepID=UPI002D21CF7F|nr:probable peptidoglycan muropeptide transporter SLC46 isoform X1 [Drosophila sulfurigaster albostrigata]
MVEKTFISDGVDRLKSLPWRQLFYMFYIEPIVFTLIFSHLLSGTVMRNEIIYQTCKVIFHYNETDCKRLDDKEAGPEIHAIETEIQSYVADMFLTRTLMESIVPAICGLFSGSWSDHYGRKPLLIASMIGFSGSSVITTIICALSSKYEINPWWYTLAALPHSLLGGMCVFSVAAFCFISDITDIKTRPYRMIFMEMLFFIALSSGSLLSSYVYAATSAAVTQGISASLITAVTVYIIFYLPESLHIRQEQEAREAELKSVAIECSDKIDNDEKQQKAKEKDEDEKKASDSDDLKQKSEKFEVETETKKAGLFSIMHLKEMLITCSKPREHNARAIIWLVTLTMFMTMFVVDGVMTVMYLFVRQKFHWSIREFTFFETVSQLVPMIGALVGFLILRKVFGLSVVVLALLSLGSEILSNLAKGFADLPWHMYLSIALGVFRSIGGPMCRTIVSNIVPASDLGKIFSIKNVLQSFAPFVAAPLYTFIYQNTLAFCPGLFNFLSAALFLVAFAAIVGVLHIKLKHKEHYEESLK